MGIAWESVTFYKKAGISFRGEQDWSGRFGVNRPQCLRSGLVGVRFQDLEI